MKQPDTTRVESTGVLNNHETFFLKKKFSNRQTDRQALLLKYLRYLKNKSYKLFWKLGSFFQVLLRF